MNNSSKRYYAKNTEDGVFKDLTSEFDGLAVLKMDGFLQRGKPINIYTAQWINDQGEDFMITTLDDDGKPVVIRENIDIELSFIVGQRYAQAGTTIDVQSVHDEFVSFLTDTDVWLKTSYMGDRSAHCVCLKEYKPTTISLGRGDKSYILGTITLHTLNAPE